MAQNGDLAKNASTRQGAVSQPSSTVHRQPEQLGALLIALTCLAGGWVWPPVATCW